MVNYCNVKSFKGLNYDLCFKYVFSHNYILKDFIDSFLRYLSLNVSFYFTNIEAQKYIIPHNKTYLGYFGDIVATLDDGTIISLELYKSTFTKSDYNKSFAYMCRLFDKNVIDSKEYKVRKIISLNLMNGNYKRINKEIVNKYLYSNQKNHQNIDEENTVMYLVRLDLASNFPYTKDERFINWLKLINATNIKEMEEIGKGDEIMEEAIEFVKKWNNKTPEENLENYIDEAKKMARTKGIEQGLEQGSNKATVKIAKNMLSMDISINDIKKATGLTIKEINKLKKDL